MENLNKEALNRMKDEFVRVLERRIQSCLETSEFAGNNLSYVMPEHKHFGSVSSLGIMVTMVHRLKSVDFVNSHEQLAELVWGNYPAISANQLLKALLKFRLRTVDISWVIELSSPNYYLHYYREKLKSLSEKYNLPDHKKREIDKAIKVIEEFQKVNADFSIQFD